MLVPTLDQAAAAVQGQGRGSAVRALGGLVRRHTLQSLPVSAGWDGMMSR